MRGWLTANVTAVANAAFGEIRQACGVAASLLGVPYSSLVILPREDEVTDFQRVAGVTEWVNPNSSFEGPPDAVIPLVRRVAQESDNGPAALESALELMNLLPN